MIFEGSRYEFDVVMRVADARGNVNPAVYPDPYADEQQFEFDFYTTAEGERYDVLAQETLGDPELWWIIARANPEVFYPDAIPYGTVIRLPRREAAL